LQEAELLPDARVVMEWSDGFNGWIDRPSMPIYLPHPSRRDPYVLAPPPGGVIMEDVDAGNGGAGAGAGAAKYMGMGIKDEGALVQNVARAMDDDEEVPPPPPPPPPPLAIPAGEADEGAGEKGEGKEEDAERLEAAGAAEEAGTMEEGGALHGLQMQVTKIASADAAVKVQLVVAGRVLEGALFQARILKTVFHNGIEVRRDRRES